MLQLSIKSSVAYFVKQSLTVCMGVGITPMVCIYVEKRLVEKLLRLYLYLIIISY